MAKVFVRAGFWIFRLYFDGRSPFTFIARGAVAGSAEVLGGTIEAVTVPDIEAIAKQAKLALEMAADMGAWQMP